MVIASARSLFTKQFDEILKSDGLRPKKLIPVSPNLNAYCERFVQPIKQACLDHFVIVSEKQLNYIVREFVRYYHEERPHQSLGNVPLSGQAPASEGEIVCRERLGGLLKHYERAAA
jgi:putative transposase